MLSQTAEHAIRALLFLAGEGAGRPVPAEEIARAIDAPRGYLAKTLNVLARAGIVSSLRGPGGGYQLRVPPAELTVERVMDEFDRPAERAICMLGDRPCDAANPCEAHELWTEMWRLSREPLRRTTLAELLGAPVQSAE